MSNLKTGELIPQTKILVKYDGKTFGPYPNDKNQLTIEIVQRELAKQFPEAARCEIGQKVLDDGSLELTFTKKAVTKGSAGQLAALFTPLPPAEVEAVRLYLLLQEDSGLETLLSHESEIGQAVEQLETQIELVKGMVKRCQALRPKPADISPPGL